MTHWITASLVSLFAVQWFTFAEASHFRHGSIAWAPTDSYSNRIRFTFRLAFRRSYSSSYNCDNSIIQSGSLLGSGDSWTAQCLNYYGIDPQCNSRRISDTGFRCTDYSSLEDWSMGENNFTYRFPSVHDKWTVSYTSCCWISLARYGNGNWLVSAVVNLARRSDTGTINSSPVSRSPAIIRWQGGCPKSIRIATEDPDGDVVRCRWATYSESSIQPDSFPYGILDEKTCVLAYNGSRGRTGTYAVALTLEDFPKGTINFHSVSPFSAVGLQFLVIISGSYGSCGDVPVFTAKTPSDGECSEVQFGSAYKAVIEVQLADLSKHIAEIVTSSPSGMQLTSLRYQQGVYYKNVTWYPNQQQVGQQLFCFKAVDSMRLESEWRCVTILVGLSNTPRVLMGTQQPLNPISKVGRGFISWSIQFDRVIKKPRSSSYIRLVLLPSGHTVYKVDTLSAYVTISSDHTTLQFAIPNAALSMNGSYAVLIDQGAVVGQGCSYDGPPTPGITTPSDWNFTINGVCPVGYYLAPPGFTNCVDMNECSDHSRSKRSPHYLWWSNFSYSSYPQYSSPIAFYSLTKSSTYAINPTTASSYFPFTVSPSGLRLVGGSWSGEGRVEIFHNGVWGTVCDDSWDINDARVVCRELGYPNASSALQSAYFGQGSGQIWLDDVICQGYESSIEWCNHRGWGVHNCGHSEDAGVICLSLRLVGGSWSGEGRVEIFHNGAWGTVCDDSWDIDDARVVCRELGYPNASSALQSAYFGQGSGKIWLDDVYCQGFESSLVRCSHGGWGVHNCGHGEDAGVICSKVLRLVGGSWSGEGRVEIFHNGVWGTVCDDYWDINDARVVCRSLGYTDASSALQSAYFGQGSGQIWLDNVNCQGYERFIEVCSHGGWGAHNCGHGEDAGVICLPNYSMSSAIRATPLSAINPTTASSYLPFTVSPSASPFTASAAILPSVSAPTTTSSTRLPSNQSECSNHGFLEDSVRGQGFYNGYNGYYQCDNGLPFGWYRFRGAAGTKMPTTCVGKNRCSSHAPGWLSTSHPSVDDGIVSGTVCFHWQSGCCAWSKNIRVRNCSGFYVYELGPPPNCWLRYCGNGGANYSMSSAIGVSYLQVKPPTAAASIYIRPSPNYSMSSAIGVSYLQVITPTAAASNYIRPSPSYNIAPAPLPTSSIRYYAQSSSVALPNPLDFQLHVPSDCDQICSNNRGSYSCSCVSGYQLDSDGKSCSDINECSINNGGCSHHCYNIPGSFYCGCPGGTTMAANNLTCVEPGVSVSCAENNMTVSLNKQTFPFFEVSKLHLRYSSCRATQNSTHLLVETPLSGCGTLVNETQDALIFWNEIRADVVIIDGVITRTHNIKLPFYCRYSRKEMLSLSFKPRNVYFGQEVGYGNFTFKLDFYKSAAFAEAYTDKDYPISIRLNDYIYVRYSVESSADLVIMAENCKATKDGSFYSWPQYNIIQNGCPRDTTMDYSYDPTRRFQQFKIRTFRFFNDYDTVYFHCEVLACHRYSPNSRCRKSCLSSKKRKRRAVTRDSLEHGESTTKTTLTGGPIRIKEKLKAAADSQSNQKGLVGGVAAAGGLVVIAVIALVVLSIKYRIARRFMERNKVADLYTAQGEQMGRRNAYIQENDAGLREDSF